MNRRVVLSAVAALSLCASLLYAIPASATPAAPISTTPPQISGSAQIAVALSASAGTWLGSPTSFAYQWLRCDTYGNSCGAISGATSSSYTPVNADYAETLRVAVTASNAGGRTSATSVPTALVQIASPIDFGVPTISGIDGEGQLLTAADGTWNYDPTGFSFQWQQCGPTGAGCSNIQNATGGNYVSQPGDVGRELRVIVTAINAGGATPAASAPTPPIGTPPVNTVIPAVSGIAQQGQALSTSDGIWTGSPAPALSVQWERCDGSGASCKPIAGATASSYVPASADVGSTLQAEVIATSYAGSATAASVPSAVVAAAPTAAAPSNAPTLTSPPPPAPPAPVTTGPPPASNAKPVITATARLAPPQLGKSADLSPVSGTVLVRLPSSSTFTRLVKPSNVPLGSTIDARAGVVTLTAALPKEASQTGRFFGGEFVLTQAHSGSVTLRLVGGSFGACPASPSTGGAPASTAGERPTTVIRQLSGEASGQFVTQGRYASTSVSAGAWVTVDRCDGTYAVATKGSVVVVASAPPHARHAIGQGHRILVPRPGY